MKNQWLLVFLLWCACLEPVGDGSDAGRSSVGGGGVGSGGGSAATGGGGATGGGATGGGATGGGATGGGATGGGATGGGATGGGPADAGVSSDAGSAWGRDGGATDAGWSTAGGCLHLLDAGDWTFTCQDVPDGGARCAQLARVACAYLTLDLAVDGDALLSSDLQNGVVLHALSGAAPPRTLSPQRSWTISLRDGVASWFEGAGLSRLVLDGGQPFILATAPNPPYSMAVSRTHVYWVPSTGTQDTILRANQSTGAVEVVASGEQWVSSLAADDSAVYWSSVENGSIRTKPLDGGATTVLFSGQHSPIGLTLVDGLLYWAEDSAPGAIRRGPVTGGVPQLVIDGLDVPRSFVTDGTTLYGWSTGGNFGTPHVFKVPAGGGAPQTLFNTQQGGVLGLSPTTLYLANYGIWALPR